MDYRLEQWINGPAGRHPFWDSSMRGAAGWGELVFIAVVALWFLCGWMRGQATDRQGALTALIAAGGALAVNQLVSHLWTRPRPFITHPDTVHALLPHSADPSFPSDHAAAGVAIAFVLLAFHRKLGVLTLLFAAMMVYARVYVGQHYPADVAAGAAIGLVVGLALVTRFDGPMAALRRLIDLIITQLRLPLPA